MKHIRLLLEKDASRMMNCLNDKDNLKYLTLSSKTYTLDDCVNFINASNKVDSGSINFAITDDNDNWCGTISLKNVDKTNLKAEYAIITDKSIHGSGIAYKATLELLEYAFKELKLNKVFLNVIPDNQRAVHFYEKVGFHYIGTSKKSLILKQTPYDLMWFEILNEDYIQQ